MTKILLALAAVFLTLSPVARAEVNVTTLPAGERELGDILTPAQIEQEMIESGEVGDDIDLTPTAGGARLKIVVTKALPQHLDVYEDGVRTMGWPVSTGTVGHNTPNGTYGVQSMHYRWTSRKYNARMDRAIFFHGGYALHQTYGDNIAHLGRPASHGCVRQSPEDGDRLFSLVKQYGPGNVTIVIR